MRTFIILTILLYSSIHCGAQDSYNRLYPEYPGYIIWDLVVDSAGMYALFSDFYEDDTNIYPNYLLKLNPNGDIIDEIELTQYDEGNPWSLIVVDSIYLSLLQLFNPSDLQVLRGNLNTKAFEISTITNLPGNGPIVAFGWTTKGDSVVILSNKFSSIGSTQIIKYALSDFQQFPPLKRCWTIMELFKM